MTHWTNLAHRTHADLEATGMRLRLDTLATRIDASAQQLHVHNADRTEGIGYDELVVGTGALPARHSQPSGRLAPLQHSGSIS